MSVHTQLSAETCLYPLIYPNNKLWVNKSVKSFIMKKKMAFQQGGASDLHTANKELKVEILKAKQSYKFTLENKMGSNSLGSAWSSMKTITGLQNSRGSTSITLNCFSSDTVFANALNSFYNRFEMFDFSKEIQELKRELCDNQHLSVKQEDVEKAFYCRSIKVTDLITSVVGYSKPVQEN